MQRQEAGSVKRVADVDRKRVLVIDDDLPLRGMLAAALRQHGFRVLLAGDGAEGHRALLIHKPDVVLLDLAMPNVNGWDFLQKLQETGHLGSFPIIVVSAHLRSDPKAVLQMGVSAILPKPFNLPDLIGLIEHLSP
ncbi:MAG TPA: response regulator [Thermoanaerobaculia bacterium]|nr:response regulator [Thermoanaerobaculia bacterium]